MNYSELDRKIRDIFPEESVYKDDSVRAIFSGRKLPSFIKDWLISKYTDTDTGKVDKEGILDFLERHIPQGEEVKLRLIKYPGKPIKLLLRVIVEPDIKSGLMRFYAPDIGLKRDEGIVSNMLLEEGLSVGEHWGVCELVYRKEENKLGYVELINFKPFRPYRVNVEYYMQARREFKLEEWLVLLVRSMEYNPHALDKDEKLMLIRRLLVFVEPNLNVIELAPKGTGKSYVFSNLSKYGILLSGGYVSRAKLFYDLQRNTEGIITKYDFVALDEVQTIRFSDEDEIRGVLKSYLENGTFNIGNYRGVGHAGFVLLGNIPLDDEKRPVESFYFKELPEVFHESALLDRFHGFIEGWKLPRFNEDMKVRGYALNVEYFSDILHLLRERGEYADLVESYIKVPQKADTRDKKAIVKLSTALLKLLFPDAPINPPSKDDFLKYCLKPAKDMRGIIRYQLSLIDAEYERQVADIDVK